MSICARAYKIEDDDSAMGEMTKVCFGCDPDNPRSVIPEKCEICHGTGRQLFAASAIAKELRASRGEKISKDREETDDLSLEY